MKKKRKICIVKPFSAPSGGGLMLDRVAHHLDVMGCCVDIVYSQPLVRGGLFRMAFRIYRSLIFYSSLSRIFSYLSLINCTKNQHYDVVIFSWYEDYERVKKIIGSDTVVVHFIQSMDLWGGSASLLYQCHSRDIYRLAVSRWLQHSFSPQVSRCGYLPVYPSLDHKMHVNKKKRLSAYLGGVWFKGSSETDYWSQYISERLGLQYCSFGKFKSELASEAFSYLTKVQLEEMLSSSRVFVSMSFYEGMPLLVLDALSCGCVVVLSDIPAHREICETLGSDRVILVSSCVIKDDDLERIRAAIDFEGEKLDVGSFYSEKHFIENLERELALICLPLD